MQKKKKKKKIATFHTVSKRLQELSIVFTQLYWSSKSYIFKLQRLSTSTNFGQGFRKICHRGTKGILLFFQKTRTIQSRGIVALFYLFTIAICGRNCFHMQH